MLTRRELLAAPLALFADHERTEPGKDVEERLSNVELAQALSFYQMLYLLNLTRTRDMNLPPIDRKGNKQYLKLKEVT